MYGVRPRDTIEERPFLSEALRFASAKELSQKLISRITKPLQDDNSHMAEVYNDNHALKMAYEYYLFFFRRFWDKEPRHSQNISHQNCHYLHRSTRQAEGNTTLVFISEMRSPARPAICLTQHLSADNIPFLRAARQAFTPRGGIGKTEKRKKEARKVPRPPCTTFSE